MIDKVRVEIDGKDMEADLDVAGTLNGSGAATGVKYVADFDGDLTIDADDVVDVKVYVTFNDQKFGSLPTDNNYSATTSTVKATIMPAQIVAEGEDGVTVGGGNRIGNTFGLKLTGTEFSNYSWSSASGATSANVDFFVTVKAEDGDVTILKSSVVGTKTLGTTTTSISAASDFTFTRVSGDAAVVDADNDNGGDLTDGFTITEGDTARFRVRFTNNGTVEATVTSFGGQEVPDDKQLSPTAILQ